MYVQDLIQNYLPDAINFVLASDIPDEAFAEAVKNQACLLAGIQSEDSGGDWPDYSN